MSCICRRSMGRPDLIQHSVYISRRSLKSGIDAADLNTGRCRPSSCYFACIQYSVDCQSIASTGMSECILRWHCVLLRQGAIADGRLCIVRGPGVPSRPIEQLVTHCSTSHPSSDVEKNSRAPGQPDHASAAFMSAFARPICTHTAH